jgi:hypothetical protein
VTPVRLHLAIHDRSAAWTAMKEDVYVSLAGWLEEAGAEVSLAAGELREDALNVVIGVQYLSAEAAKDLAGGTAAYGIFDVEILSDQRVNFKEETRYLFSQPARALFERARFFWTYFEESAATMRSLGVDARVLRLGWCEHLARRSPSQPTERQDIDVLFFGHVDDHRRRLLEELGAGPSWRILRPDAGTPQFLRDSLARRAKVVLSLGREEPFGHIGPMRLVSMAHLGVASVSERPRRAQAGLEGLARFFETPAEGRHLLAELLASPTARAAAVAEARQALRAVDTAAQLGDHLEASSRGASSG